ncbi:hypothetical protein [Nocardia testacea]|uniref:hypothetical protein n=1 Tax=Nocardia testacea TaxID=248551 RepID=UPI0033E1F87F
MNHSNLVNHSNTAPQGPRAVLLTGWTDLWNGDITQASRICASTVRVRFGGRAIGALGDEVRTARELADLIEDFRSTRPGLTYSVVEARTTEDWGHCVWNASMGDLHVGGIDTFTFDGVGITEVHSVTAERPMSLSAPAPHSRETAG